MGEEFNRSIFERYNSVFVSRFPNVREEFNCSICERDNSVFVSRFPNVREEFNCSICERDNSVFVSLFTGLKPHRVIEQLNSSLASLQLNCVDIFYLHAPDHDTEIGDTLKAVHQLHTGKLI